MTAIFYILVLVFSVILHEVAHGYMANSLGDPTARLQKRLTLNPISHIDPMGTIILPLLMWAGQGFVSNPFLLGYAKPVPYNPYNLRGRFAEALVSFAGPGTNLLLAIIFGVAIRIMMGIGTPVTDPLILAFGIITQLNLLLALFNLIPIPPLDGSKVLSAILPGGLGRVYDDFRHRMERLGVLSGTLLFIVIFYFFLLPFFYKLVQLGFTLITGL